MSLTALIDHVKANPADDAGWSRLMTTALAGQQISLAGDLLVARHQMRQDAARYCYDLACDLARDGNTDALSALYDAAGPDGAFRAFFAYGLGLAAAAHFDLEQTVSRIREAAHAASFCLQQVFSHEDAFARTFLGEVLQQAAVLDLPAAAPAVTSAPIPIFPDLPPSDLLIFAASCERYFLSYGDRFIREAHRRLPDAVIQIHIINPTPDGEALRAVLQQQVPRCVFSSEQYPPQPGRSDAIYFACRRLMLAPALRHHAGRDLVVLDIDSVFPETFDEILSDSRSADVAVFCPSGALLPSLRVSCAFLFLKSARPAADQFLDLTSAFLQRKLSEDVTFWTVDQAALFQALCLLPDRNSAVLDLTSRFPAGIQCLVDPEGHRVPAGERQARRQSRPISAVTFDQANRPIFE